MQRGMLFHHLSSERPGVDLEQIICRLPEDLQLTQLTTAWQAVVARHEVLRSSFRWEDLEEPEQEVHATQDLSVEFHDCSELDFESQEARLEEFLQADRRRGFDFDKPPLMRLAVFRNGPAEHLLIWSFPHILLDGRAFPLVLGEVFDLYDAMLDGRDCKLPAPASYREHVAWINSRDWTEAEEFWRERLNGFASATSLPGTNDGRSAESRGERELQLSKELSSKLREFAEKQGLSLNNLLQGAWALLLSRHSGDRDIVFGATRACRSSGVADAKRTVGLFINTLPVRVDVDSDMPVVDWLSQLRSSEREVYPHEHAPLMDVQTWNDAAAGKPLFESIIVYDNWLLGSHMQERGGRWTSRDCELREQASYPLVLYGYGEESILLKLAYDSPRFSREFASRLLDHLNALLEGFVADPGQRLGSISILSGAEREQLIETWNGTATEYAADACIQQLIEAQVARRPEEVALVFEDEQISYRELDSRANQLARKLRSLGLGPDALVGVCVERSIALVVSVLAIHKAGAAYLPLAPEYPSERLNFMLADAGAAVLITQEHLLTQLGEHAAETLFIDKDWPAIARESDAALDSIARPENLAYVIYTSGSTGKPKGVMVEHRNVTNFFAGMDTEIPHDPPGVWLAVTSLSFDISVLELLWTLARGFKVVIHADQARVAQRLQTEKLGRKSSSNSLAFSLMYFASNEGTGQDNYRLLMEGAKFADENGFQAVWTPERHFHAFGGLYPNPSVTSAALAAATKRLHLRAGSVVLPNHHPVRVAEEWSLVDNLSGGRVGLSAASGWQPNDFVFCPENFADSKNIMFEHLETVRRLWRGDEIEFPGPKGPVKVRTLPRPVQAELPVWITAAGNAETFRMAGEIGANVLTHLLGQTVDEVADKIRIYRDAWQKAGHDPAGGHVTLMLHTFIGDDVDEVRETVRRPMKNYLLSAVGLVRSFVGAWTAFKRRADGSTADVDLDMDSLTPEELDGLADFSFERYFGTSALFGTPDSCIDLVQSLQEMGVNEIACLVDFGVDSDKTLEHLEHLNTLRKRAAQLASPPEQSDPMAASAATSDASAVEKEHGIAAQIREHRVTHMQCTPSMASMLLLDADSRSAMSELSTLMVGGEALPGHLAQELRASTAAEIINMYGPTETTIWSTTHRYGDDAQATIPIGRPIANTQVYVLDDSLQAVPVGVPGELFIGGVGVVRGYHNRPELTSERFVPDHFARQEGQRLYRTGDLVRYLADGTLEFLGRTDFQVKIRGQRIELGEIEACLMDDESLRDAVVLAREDVPGDQRLVAYVIPHASFSLDEERLRTHLRERLPEWMLPAHYVELREFPQTPNRKVDRKALPAPSADPGRSRKDFVAPESDVEDQIASIWKEVLRVPQVGREDNFFDLGGHSLLAVKTHRRLCEIFAHELRIIDLFRFPTLRSLAEHISGSGSAPSLERSQERADMRRKSMSRRRAARSGPPRGGPRSDKK